MQKFHKTQYDSFENEQRKTFSKLFFSLTFSMIISYLILLLIILAIHYFPNLPKSLSLVINDCYTIFTIILFCIFSKGITSRRPLALSDMTKGKFFLFVCASVPLMLAGALIGNILSSLLSNILGHDIVNAIGSLAQDYPFPLVFVSVIVVAPVFEELMFRKLLIDKISHFGFSFSVIFSGLVFGTFHGNFYQIFYGCLLGFVLAFIYCMYGKLSHCIALHSLINFIGFICPMYFSEFLSSANFLLKFFAMCYFLVYYLCIPLGIGFVVIGIKTIRIKYPSLFCMSGISLAFKNFGFVFYIVFVVIMLTFSVLP